MAPYILEDVRVGEGIVKTLGKVIILTGDESVSKIPQEIFILKLPVFFFNLSLNHR